MPFDEAHAEILRAKLRRQRGITEQKMFGGLCFMLNGHMLCGVHKDGGMARVGKENEAAALQLPGVAPLSFTGRPMGGMIELDESVFEDTHRLDAVLSLARQFVYSLPPK